MYNPKDIIDLIAANVEKTKNPFGVPKSVINTWWKKALPPQSGDAMLFTGLMYQFAPYIETATAYLSRYEDTRWADYIKYGRYVPKLLSGLGLAAITPVKEKRRFNGILMDIAAILTRSKVDYYYNPGLDDYSGVLLYDLGDQDGFMRHARHVAARLQQAGVTKLITVDPHTTYALKTLFPKYTGQSFEVHTYFELLDLTSRNGQQQITLHDPCFYGRYLELSEVPARVLAKMNISCAPLRNSGPFTNCCGGPAESISPKLSKEVGRRRIEELQCSGDPIVAMCPICLGNLRKAGAQVEDLSTVLARNAA
jgi:Fe-S oxidoreductase